MMTTPASLTELNASRRAPAGDLFASIVSAINDFVATYMELLNAPAAPPQGLQHPMSARAQRLMRTRD